MVIVDEADLDNVHELAPKLREADLLEVTLLGLTPHESLIKGLDGKSYSITEHSEDKEPSVMSMFGVSKCPHLQNYGVAWMLSSKELEQYHKPFLRFCRDWIEVMHEDYEILYNIVHSKNAQGMRWLQWCGFEIKTQRPFGFSGEDFYLFIREK